MEQREDLHESFLRPCERKHPGKYPWKPRTTTRKPPAAAECITNPTPPTSAPTSTTSVIDTTSNIRLTICEETLVNSTQALLKYITQVDELRQMTEIMKDIIEKDPDGRKLKLTGRITDDGPPEQIVKRILTDKYSLDIKILTAYQNKNGEITFEVKLEDKIAIIKKQKELSQVLTSVRITY